MANGGLDLFYDRFDGRQFSVDAQMTNGNARILIPRNGSFRIRAETTTGEIINEFASSVELNGHGGRKIDLSVGQPERSEITVRVTSGDITVAEAKPANKSPERN